MSYTIQKSFEFDYGHRVHNQVLNEELAGTTLCKCRYLHGHRGKVIVKIPSAKLNSRGMVFDFNNFNIFKKWLDATLDHKLILHTEDPLIDSLDIDRERSVKCSAGASIFSCCLGGEDPYDPFGAGLVLFSKVPTSENLAWACSVIFKILTGEQCSVEFWETPKSMSYFTPFN